MIKSATDVKKKINALAPLTNQEVRKTVGAVLRAPRSFSERAAKRYLLMQYSPKSHKK